MKIKQIAMSVIFGAMLVYLGTIIGAEKNQKDCVERILPTQLFLTVVDEQKPPQVCILDIATETVRGDTLRVVVNRARCPALQ